MGKLATYRDSDTGETSLDVVQVPEGHSLQLGLEPQARALVDSPPMLSIILDAWQAADLSGLLSPRGGEWDAQVKHTLADMATATIAPSSALARLTAFADHYARSHSDLGVEAIEALAQHDPQAAAKLRTKWSALRRA